MVWSWLSCDPRSNLTSQNHKLLSKCPRKWKWKIPNFVISVEFQNYFLGYWIKKNCLDISGFTKDHNWVMTKPYQTKSSLLRPYFRCFWPIFWPNLIFFPFSQVLPPHPTTTLVWGIQEHLSHVLKLFFCLVMLQDQCGHDSWAGQGFTQDQDTRPQVSWSLLWGRSRWGLTLIIKSSVPCLIILLDSNTLKQSFHIVSHQEGARFELESVREREL